MRKFFIFIPSLFTAIIFLTARGDNPQALSESFDLFTREVHTSLTANSNFGRLPLSFVPNRGQMDKRVSYYVQGKDKTIYFTPEGLTIALQRRGYLEQEEGMAAEKRRRSLDAGMKSIGAWEGKESGEENDPAERWIVKLDFVGANPDSKPKALEETGAVISYFRGKPENWLTRVPTYSKIIYPDLWPGIDLVYSGTFQQLKYEFIVHPGADPSRIRLAYRGASQVTMDEKGQLLVETPEGSFHDGSPEAYQEIGGKRVNVAMSYRLLPEAGDSAKLGSGNGETNAQTFTYGFDVANYDKTQTLVLDPVIIIYCGFIGGSDLDNGRGIAVDNSGNAYIMGVTSSDESSFPVTVGPDLTYSSNQDVFVAKVNASGTALVYCGFIGGVNEDSGFGLAIDSSGNAYVGGLTYSDESTFPVITGPDLTFNGVEDAFVAKVNASGTALVYCGYIGGSINDFGQGIAVDSSGAAYLVGFTYSDHSTFPVTVGPDLTYNGGSEGFVAKINASGTGLVYCGYIGGSNLDEAKKIAVDSAGNAYITGLTYSDEGSFPVDVGPDLTFNGGVRDAFVAKVNSSGTALVYCGYIGGAEDDRGLSIAVDNAGYAYVTGLTYSDEGSFPVAVGPDLTYNGSQDAFVAKVNSSGQGLVYCGYIGGSSWDYGKGIAIGASGNAYVTGQTFSDERTFPVIYGPNIPFDGSEDGYVAKVDASGKRLVYCGYIGGVSGNAIALDILESVYITGMTSGDSPVIIGPDLTYNGGADAFVAKIVAGDRLGVFINGKWFLDLSGNGVWDGTPGDIVYTFGSSGYTPVVGDWNGDGRTEIGTFVNGKNWFLDYNTNGVWDGVPTDKSYVFGASGVGFIPVRGDWNGDGKAEIGVFLNGNWYLDYNGNGVWDGMATDRYYHFGSSGYTPVTGDWDGDGVTEIGVVFWGKNWFLDYNGNGVWDGVPTDKSYVFGASGFTPVTGDWNGDGKVEVGVFIDGNWFLDYNGNGVWDGTATDRAYHFGSSGYLPVVGGW